MKEIFEKLFQNEELSYTEAKECLGKITEGTLNPSQVGAFVSAYRMRPIIVDEIRGFRDALLERCKLVEIPSVIDLCGSGGDNKNTFNISTLSSFIVAACGARVAKHGNYGVSSTCGSSHILEALGVKFRTKKDALLKDIDTTGMTFFHAPLFHPTLKNVAPIRKELGFRTFFNILGPLVNPAKPTNQLCGVLNIETARLYSSVLSKENINYKVVTSLDGYDEISLTGPWKIFSQQGDAEYTPSKIGLCKVTPIDLDGGHTIEDGVRIFKEVISGKGSEAKNNVVCVNAAFALITYFQDMEYSTAYNVSYEALKSGKAKAVLEKLIDLN